MASILPHIAALISHCQTPDRSSAENQHQAETKTTKASSMLSLFHLLDRTGTGEVTASELLHSVTELGLTLTDDEIDEMMRIADLSGNGKIEFSEFCKLMEALLPVIKEKPQRKVSPALPNGVRDLWSRVDHIAIVVSDIGRSSAFYGSKLGMLQLLRPDFDRFGAWFTMGNINLHLINGRPIVHPDDDLIVSHIAIDIGTEEKMEQLIRRFDSLGVAYRENVSVPKGTTGAGQVKQAFVRDPDGYYLEFCSCRVLEDYLEQAQVEYESVLKADQQKTAAEDVKEAFQRWKQAVQQHRLETRGERAVVDEAKLEKLLKRQAIYGDITQSASKEHLQDLLSVCNNDIPEVIKCLMEDARAAGGRTFKPPAFFERDEDHTFVQPPSFQMSRQDKVATWRRNEETGTDQQQATASSSNMKTSSSSESLISNTSSGSVEGTKVDTGLEI